MIATIESSKFPILSVSSSSPSKGSSEIENEKQEEAIIKLFVNKLQSCINLANNKPDPNFIGIYEFEILFSSNNNNDKQKNGLSVFFTVDLKVGRLYQGRSDTKSDCCLQIKANDLIQLLNGQLDFAQAFLTGKLKVLRGNASSAFKFHRFLMDSVIHANNSMIAEPNHIQTTEHTKSIHYDIPVDGLKSDVIFETIRNKLATESDLIKQIPFVVQINLTKTINGHSKHIATWTLDTKTTGGRIYRSSPLGETKPDATITVDDEDYVAILFGKLNPQRVFISGKMKIKGNIMLLQRLNQFWIKIHATRQGPDYPWIKEILLNTQLKPGLQSELIFFTFLQRLVKLPERMLPPECVIRIIITKHGHNQVEWIITYDSQSRLSTVKHIVLDGKQPLIFDDNSNPLPKCQLNIHVDDEIFTRLLLDHKEFSFQQAIEMKQVQLYGDNSLVPILSQLFDVEPQKLMPDLPNVLKAKL